MKLARMSKIALLAIALTSLVGCASETFHQIDGGIKVGDKTYTALLAKDVDPWGVNVSSIVILGSENEDARPQPMMAAGPPQRPAPQQLTAAPGPRHHASPPPDPRQPQVASAQAPRPTLMNTQVVNVNNANCIGWANGAFQGAVGDAIMGASTMGAACLLKPPVFKGGGASSSSSSSSAASASGG